MVASMKTTCCAKPKKKKKKQIWDGTETRRKHFCGVAVPSAAPGQSDVPTSAELSERVCLTTAEAPPARQKCQSGDAAPQRERSD